MGTNHSDVVARFGKLDILVNNAGISGSGEKDFGSSQAWDQLMDVNAKSVFLGMKHAIPEMEKAGGGNSKYLIHLRHGGTILHSPWIQRLERRSAASY
ncbi:MAG: hypothetical protein CM1200mP22_30650 [Dehalococcoidia bacterium]|nr:MAG: hypothetical protein CM1200mP22_30650 [Dehalococcoidia bacterium]